MELNGGSTVNTIYNTSVLYSVAQGQSVGTFMSRPQKSAARQPNPAWPSAANPGIQEHVAVFQNPAVANPYPAMFFQQSWLDDETREAYMEATVEQDIAWQIALNRKARKLSQSDLAKRCQTRQSAIARIEDPTYGKHSLAMLVKVAHAFECALRVKLIPYSQLAEEIQDTSPEALTVASFSDERHLIPQTDTANHE